MNIKNTKLIGLVALLSIFMIDLSFGERGYDLDEFDDLELESLDSQKRKLSRGSDKGQRLILFDDNLYLLDDDFDFGEDEIELQKLELDPDDMETAKEYEFFLNAFFENSTPVGTGSYNNPNKSIQKQSKKSSWKNNAGSKSSKNVKKRTKKSAQSVPQFTPNRGAMGFGLSTIIGATVPVTMNGYSTGSNFGVRIDTPISFNLAGMEANVGTDIYFSSMTASEGTNNFKLTNMIGNVSVFPLPSVEVRTGLGLTPTSIGDYSVTALSIPIDVNYYLPLNLSGFKFALNLHAQRTLGYPSDEGVEEGDSTDFLYLGFLINTPLKF